MVGKTVEFGKVGKTVGLGVVGKTVEIWRSQ